MADRYGLELKDVKKAYEAAGFDTSVIDTMISNIKEEKAEREAREKVEKVAKEKALKEAKEKAEREAREKEARDVAEKMVKYRAEKEAEIQLKKSRKIICPMCGAMNDSTRTKCNSCHSSLI